MDKINILMCGSKVSVKGGMVSVVNNYLGYNNWEEFSIKYVPTHIEKNKIIVAIYFLFAYIRLLALVIVGRYDVLYLHTAERGSFFRKAILVRTFQRLGIKTVMHHHAAEFDLFYDNLSDKAKIYVNSTLEMADLNIVLSNRLVPTITKKAPNAKVSVLYNSVKTYDANPYNNEANNVLFLGRLGKRKGAYDLLKVIKNIGDKLPKDVKFYLCGDGDIENIKLKIKEYGIEHRIAYVGWIDSEAKKEIFRNIAVNVLPSYNEGLPMSILETMAYGIPNISTNIASIPEVIKNGINGYMVDPGDIVALEKYILELCQDKNLLIKFSDAAWSEITTRFSMDTNMECLKQDLRVLCSRGLR